MVHASPRYITYSSLTDEIKQSAIFIIWLTIQRRANVSLATYTLVRRNNDLKFK